MEIVGADGSRTQVKPGQTMELGRSQGLNSSDKTISRRHIAFFVPTSAQIEETRLQFEVLGRNPVYVNRNGKVVIFRRFERGVMGSGDMFCCSSKHPIWYDLRATENCDSSVRGNDLAGNLESDFGFNGVEDLRGEGVDISDIDAVREFGFLVMGHEFDSYSKKMIGDLKILNWFLEEAHKDIEDGDDDDKGKKGKGCGRRKRKKGKENDDEEWKGESEDEKELINTRKKGQKAKYATRSKDRGKQAKDASISKNITRRDKDGDLDDEDEEDDEKLGGFIIDDENLEAEEGEGEIEEEYGEDEDEDE